MLNFTGLAFHSFSLASNHFYFSVSKPPIFPLSFSHAVSRLSGSRSSITEETPPTPTHLSSPPAPSSNRPSMGVSPLIRERTRSFDDPDRRRLAVASSGSSTRSASSERPSSDEKMTSPRLRHENKSFTESEMKMANIVPRPITFTTGEKQP